MSNSDVPDCSQHEKVALDDNPSNNLTVTEFVPIVSELLVSQLNFDEEKRTRKQTEKGHNYQLGMVKQAYAQSIRDFKKSLKTLVLESIASSDVEAIGKAMKAAFAASTKVDDCFAVLESYLSSAEMVSYYKENKELERELIEGTAEYKKVIRSLNREQRSDVSSVCLSRAYREMGPKSQAEENASQVSCSTSNRSGSLQQDRLLKLEKAAALRAQLSYHEAQAKMKEKRLSLEQEEQRLNLECQIAGLEASAQVLKLAESEKDYQEDPDLHLPHETVEEKQNRIMDSITNDSNHPEDVLLPSEEYRVLDPLKRNKTKANDMNWQPKKLPRIDDNSQMEVQADLVKTGRGSQSLNLASPLIGYQLPQIKIEAFNGKVTEYPAWEIAFNALIDQNVESVELKLNLLSQHMTGEAKSLVSGLLTNHTEAAYAAARSRLKERYGNPSIISQAFLNQLEEWPQIKANQPHELQHFSDMLVQIAEIRKTFAGNLGVLDFPQESRKILAKLPFYFEKDWREAVCKWKDKHGSCSYSSFDQLVEFIERRTKRANLPELQTISKPSAPGKVAHQEKKREMKNVKVLSTKADGQVTKCSYCTKEHDTNACEDFLALGRDAALKFLKENKLCFGCGRTAEHMSHQCQSRSTCSKCKKKHLTALHIEATAKEANSSCTEVCSQPDQHDGIDNSLIVPVWVRSKSNMNSEILC